MIKTERVENEEVKKRNELRWIDLRRGACFVFEGDNVLYIKTDCNSYLNLSSGFLWSSTNNDTPILRATPVNPYKYTVEEV